MAEYVQTTQSQPCPGCGGDRWIIPAAPRALPGNSIPADRVVTVCGDCDYQTTLDQAMQVVMVAER